MKEFLDSCKPLANVEVRGEYLVNCFGQNRRVEYWTITGQGVVHPVAIIEGDHCVVYSDQVLDHNGSGASAFLERADVLKEFKRCSH